VTDQEATGPTMLQGYRVVELAVWVAGPSAAGILSDWGADVVKVEPPGGDPQRGVFGALGVADQAGVPPFEVDNRGKRSIVLDLRREPDLATMHRLLETADVFVTNLRLDALDRLGLGHDEVRARHPGLVYALVTGYGTEGPDAHRPGYDVGAFWARSGAAHTFVPPGELPPGIRSGFGDHATGMTMAAGILAALLDRERSGEGRFVTTSLLRTGMYCLSWDIGIQLRFGKRERTRPREKNRAPLILCYAAGDGRAFWLLGLEADRHWPGLVAAIQRPDLAADERFVDAVARLRNSEALIAALDEVFATRTMDEWTERFDANDVWWAPINSIVDVIADPQARAAGAFVAMTPRDGEAPYEAVATPVDFEGWDRRPGPVPSLGEHTAEVLAELDDRT
jgi:crotonobetainyl-CoA:carnitine CoA-transferase CaiB-like acyl-CoA transferase